MWQWISVISTLCFHDTVWKNKKFFLTKKIFRQINSLVTYLVKPSLSRNFCQKCVRENSRNFHTVAKHNVEITEIYSHTFRQKFVNVTTVLLKNITNELIWRNIFLMRVNSSFFPGGKIPIILILEKIFRKINFNCVILNN